MSHAALRAILRNGGSAAIKGVASPLQVAGKVCRAYDGLFPAKSVVEEMVTGRALCTSHAMGSGATGNSLGAVGEVIEPATASGSGIRLGRRGSAAEGAKPLRGIISARIIAPPIMGNLLT